MPDAVLRHGLLWRRRLVRLLVAAGISHYFLAAFFAFGCVAVALLERRMAPKSAALSLLFAYLGLRTLRLAARYRRNEPTHA